MQPLLSSSHPTYPAGEFNYFPYLYPHIIGKECTVKDSRVITNFLNKGNDQQVIYVMQTSKMFIRMNGMISQPDASNSINDAMTIKLMLNHLGPTCLCIWIFAIIIAQWMIPIFSLFTLPMLSILLREQWSTHVGVICQFSTSFIQIPSQ